MLLQKNSRLNSDFIDLGFICKEKNIKCKYTEDINDIHTIQFILELKPDIILNDNVYLD